jgi:hypothetical protein
MTEDAVEILKDALIIKLSKKGMDFDALEASKTITKIEMKDFGLPL